VEFLINNCTAPQELVLKEGAAVMFVKNKYDDVGGTHYVNGTLGKVIGFNEHDNYPIVETFDGKTIVASPRAWTVEEEGEILAQVTQVPLRLAWAITVHKSQGMSLDGAVIDLREAFDYGMGYVALSRVRSLEGIQLLGLNNKALQVNPEIFELDKKFLLESKSALKEYKQLGKKEVTERQKRFLQPVTGRASLNLLEMMSLNI
jgi:ATP-dependent exoDNAse (exonuclease V) alpha subunit